MRRVLCTELALAGCLRLLLTAYAWLLIVLAFSNLCQSTSLLAHTLESTQCAINGLVLTNLNLVCHLFFPPSN